MPRARGLEELDAKTVRSFRHEDYSRRDQSKFWPLAGYCHAVSSPCDTSRPTASGAHVGGRILQVAGARDDAAETAFELDQGLDGVSTLSAHMQEGFVWLDADLRVRALNSVAAANMGLLHPVFVAGLLLRWP